MMIWARFQARESSPDWRVILDAHNLFYYAQHGPSQLTRCLDSPMLEQAHERRFAISQIGSVGVGFETEHTIRMQDALATICQHFSGHPTDQCSRPSSPHADCLAGLRKPSHPFHPLPPLDAHDLAGGPDPETPTPSSIQAVVAVDVEADAEPDKPTRSPLDLREMMNPEPTAVASSSSSLKRKWSPEPFELTNRIVPDEDQSPPDEFDRFQLHYTSSRRPPTNMAGDSSRTMGELRLRIRNRQRSREHSKGGGVSRETSGAQLHLDRDRYLLLRMSHITTRAEGG